MKIEGMKLKKISLMAVETMRTANWYGVKLKKKEKEKSKGNNVLTCMLGIKPENKPTKIPRIESKIKSNMLLQGV